MMTEHELAELVGRLGNSYTKKGLSPPFALRDAVKHWLGLAQDEIVTVLQKHFEDYRRFYTAGAGEQHFGMVQLAIRRALETKHPPIDRADDEPAQPPRKPAGPRNIYTIGGFADAIVDHEDGEDAETDA
jgi:hypothetical protein